ncbi:MAG: hypothetical protein NZT61_01085 [Deltaproteobacteria bacterium]|nr:hypothetical protein [Deltaproteobacteria bacterium]
MTNKIIIFKEKHFIFSLVLISRIFLRGILLFVYLLCIKKLVKEVAILVEAQRRES